MGFPPPYLYNVSGECSSGFYPLSSALLLYLPLRKVAQSHDFKYLLLADDSQIYFSSSDLSLDLQNPTAY